LSELQAREELAEAVIVQSVVRKHFGVSTEVEPKLVGGRNGRLWKIIKEPKHGS